MRRSAKSSQTKAAGSNFNPLSEAEADWNMDGTYDQGLEISLEETVGGESAMFGLQSESDAADILINDDAPGDIHLFPPAGSVEAEISAATRTRRAGRSAVIII